MSICQNRLVLAVLIMLGVGTLAHGGSVEPRAQSVRPTTQPWQSFKVDDSADSLQHLTDSIFKTNHDNDVTTPVLQTESDSTKETVVIPFPTTFWTGLTTLAGMAGFYIKRRIRP